MKFKVCEAIRFQSSLRDITGVESEVSNRLPYGNPLRVLIGQKSFIHIPHQSSTADERNTKANSFFLRKANDLDSERQPPPIQHFQQGNPKNYAENTIISAGVRNCIEMRTNQKSWRIKRRAGINCPQISSGIDLNFQSQKFHPRRNLPMAVLHRGR